jgi:hypothetical protein
MNILRCFTQKAFIVPLFGKLRVVLILSFKSFQVFHTNVLNRNLYYKHLIFLKEVGAELHSFDKCQAKKTVFVHDAHCAKLLIYHKLLKTANV